MSDTKRLYGLRGAVCCAENTEASIQEAVSSLASMLFGKNPLSADDIVSIQFSMTSDLTALNAAAALRRSPYASVVSNCALFCTAEAQTDGGLEKTIRVLITAYSAAPPVHVYTGGAEALRPDLVPEQNGCF